MSDAAIVNGKVITSEGILPDGAVLIEGDTIADVCAGRDAVKGSSEIIDARGNYIAPGMIDIHCHAGGGSWVYDNPAIVSKNQVFHGVTGYLPTIPYTLYDAQITDAIEKILQSKKKCFGEIVLGINMEGPYINNKYGMASWCARTPSEPEYEKYCKAAKNEIKIWTFAPEVANTDAFAAFLKRKGIVQAVGHSEAPGELIDSMADAALATHCMDATGTPPSKCAGTREYGIDEAVLLNDRIYAEVIADSKGLHVRPQMLRLILKAKGIDKVVIISDATEFTQIQSSMDSDDLCFNEYGQLAGSKLTMDLAVRNMIRHTGIGLTEAFRMASLNPARLLKMENRLGSIAAGKKANIIIIDDTISVKKVILNGKLVA